MRLIFIINVFNEARNIAKCIESVNEVADEIWVFDGAYKQYPHKEFFSTDGTLEIVKKYPKVKLYECSKVWDDQLQKRTAMFKDGKEGDIFFKLDGDEYITNPEVIRDYLTNEIDVGWVWTISNLYDKPIMTARIFKWQEGLHYAGRHHWLYNGKKQFVTSDQYMNSRFKHKQTVIRLINFRDSSCTKRRNDKAGFLMNRNPDELSFSREDKVYNRFCQLVSHPHRAGKPRVPTTILREIDRPEYTFTLMISRKWAVKKYFKHLSTVKLPKSIEAVVVVDSKDDKIKRDVIKYFREDKRFGGVKIYITNNAKLPEFADVIHRRQRIVDNWHILLSESRGKIMLASEDDSLPEPNAYMKLLEIMKEEKADFVQANIIGRWKAKICPAWQIHERDGKPVLVWNAKEKETGVHAIQGCGWYCFVSPVDVVRKYQMYVDDITPLGPDLSFGYHLAKNGFKLLHSWDVKVEHFGENFSLYPGKTETEQRMWLRDADGRWMTKPYSRNFIKGALAGEPLEEQE